VPQHVDLAKLDLVLDVHGEAATEFGFGSDRLHAPDVPRGAASFRARAAFNGSMNRVLAGVLALALLAPAAATPAFAQTKPTIRLGYICGGMNPMIAELGLNDGAYQRAGLDVEKECFTAGAPAIAALIGGSVDVFVGSPEHALRAQSRGIDVKIFGCIQNAVGYALVVKAGSTFKTLDDLKGQTVAITAPQSLSDTGLRQGLLAAGINPDRDLSIIAAGSGASMVAALETDRVAAGMVSPPELQRLVDTKKYRMLYDPQFDYPGIVIMSRADFASANAGAMQTFVRVLEAETVSARTTPAVAAATMNKEFPDIDPALMLSVVKRQVRAVPAGFAVPPKGLETVNAIEVKAKTIPAPIPFAQVVDTRFIASLK
jgi:ABC-type nitrate/sulfonate/bicarbonate transport system substrate-binding protein